jgi:branched-subunit amino acid transport protein
MTAVWVTIVAVAAVSALIKASGPLVLGTRELPERARAAVALLAPALLAALVVSQTFARDGALVLDARALGLGVAALALAARAPLLLAITLAAAAAALARAL